MNRGLLLGLLSVFCLTAQAGPQINVGTVYDYLEADKSTYLKRVFNSGDATAFVKINVLEIVYDDKNYVYRIEKRAIEGALPKRTYRLKKAGEVESLRGKYNLNKESFLFDELPEPIRDRLILAMADIQKARSHVYDKEGRLIRGLEEKVILKNSTSFKNKIPNLNI